MSLYSRCFLILLLFVIFSFSAFSATKTWTGNGSDNKFTTAANWAENLPAAIGDDLIFPAVATQYSLNQDLIMSNVGSQSFKSLTFEGGNYVIGGAILAVSNGNGIIINGGNQNLGQFLHLYGTLYVAENASITARFHVNNSAFTIDGLGSSNLTSFGSTGNSYIKQGTGTSNFSWVNSSSVQSITVNGGRIIATGGISTSVNTVQVNSGTLEGTIGSATNINFVGQNAELKSSNTALSSNFQIINGAKFSPTSCSINNLSTFTLNLTGAVFNPVFTNCSAKINYLFFVNGITPVTGFFTNYPEGSIINIGGKNYRMTYRGGDGNDVQLIRVNYPNDFDGDGKSDISVFRPNNNYWYLQQSTAGFTAMPFGQSGDIITPADYTGDNKTDIAVFRPSNGTWYVFRSEDNTFYGIPFGISGDIPVSADYTGDGKADLAVYRPSNGTWYRLNSENNSFYTIPFGISADKPTVGDFDGDGKADIAVFRPSNGTWYRLNSTNNSFFSIQFGQSGDKIVPADYTGDGRTDIAVYRDGNWYVLRSEDLSFYGLSFGIATDTPSPADYDGDGKADIAVYRNGNWYLLQSTNGFSTIPFGITNDISIPSAFVY